MCEEPREPFEKNQESLLNVCVSVRHTHSKSLSRSCVPHVSVHEGNVFKREICVSFHM